MVRKAVLSKLRSIFILFTFLLFCILTTQKLKNSPNHSEQILCYLKRLHSYYYKQSQFCHLQPECFLIFSCFFLSISHFQLITQCLISNVSNISFVSHYDCSQTQDNRMYSLNQVADCKIAPENSFVVPAIITLSKMLSNNLISNNVFCQGTCAPFQLWIVFSLLTGTSSKYEHVPFDCHS